MSEEESNTNILNNSNISNNNNNNNINNNNNNNNNNINNTNLKAFLKQTTSNLEEVNSTLLKSIQNLENENIQLKEALHELNIDLNDKEDSISKSQKIISLLKEEYSKIIKQYKNLEESNKNLEQKNNENKKIFENLTKTHLLYEKIQKQNEYLKTEIEKKNKDLIFYKENYNNLLNQKNNLENNNKHNNLIINDLKIEGNKFIDMIKERENIITNYNKKIKDLNEIIKKLLMKKTIN